MTASSVDGEDDVVDVHMKDATNSDERGAKSSQASEFPLKKFRTRRPKFLNPKEYLRPELQNMFDMSYFTENNDLIPSGWSAVNEERVLPNLVERDPRLQAEIRRAEQRGRRSRSEDSSTQGSDDDQPGIGGPTRMVEESSDEDAEPKVRRPAAYPQSHICF